MSSFETLTMKVEELLEILGRESIHLHAEGDELVVRGRGAALTDDLVKMIRSCKDGILDHLRARDAAARLDGVLPERTSSLREDDDCLAEVSRVFGGLKNIEDAYPLAPLQEGIFFHHLLNEQGDVYLLPAVLSFDDRPRLDRFVAALQAVIDRNDVLRTSIAWEGLNEPLQVVWRHAPLLIGEIDLPANDDALSALRERFHPSRFRMDIRKAPMLRAFVGRDNQRGQWLLTLIVHHLVIDHTAMQAMMNEIRAFYVGNADGLLPPAPYGDFVRSARRSVDSDARDAFFSRMLGDIEETTAAFGRAEVHGDGTGVREAGYVFDLALSKDIRRCAGEMGASAASLFHLAWARVLSSISGRADVVFGTVLFGRMHGREASQRALGMFINTLPLRVTVRDMPVREALGETHRLLAELLRFENSSLSSAQRCSGAAPSTPLFATLFNYRHAGHARDDGDNGGMDGIHTLFFEERTNYPLMLSVNDSGEGFSLTVQVVPGIEPDHILELVRTTIVKLVDALLHAPATPIGHISVLSVRQLRELQAFAGEAPTSPVERFTLQALIDEQVDRTPSAIALRHRDEAITYADLRSWSRRLARTLSIEGVTSGAIVGLAMERGIDLVVGMFAVLRAGAAFVSLDPAYPSERIAWMIGDARPQLVLTHAAAAMRFDPDVRVLAIESIGSPLPGPVEGDGEEEPGTVHVAASDLAYVIYTSGSTGRPKGTLIEHRQAVNLIRWAGMAHPAEAFEETLFSTSLNFDLAIYECFVPLSVGGCVRIVDDILALTAARYPLTLINTVPSAISALLDADAVPRSVRYVNLAGEVLRRDVVERLFAETDVQWVCNLYGPSETTTYSTWVRMTRDEGFVAGIGRPIGNTRIYLLDEMGQPVPIGAEGEMHIGGAGVARGYLGRPVLTRERFIADSLGASGTRLYRTGDMARWMDDGTLEYLGRRDDQLKIHGHRIEPGEVEAQLASAEGVGEVVVVGRDDGAGRRLVAYVVASAGQLVREEALRDLAKRALPDYLRPASYVFLDRLPMTPNGKVDRMALPMPASAAPRKSEPPEGHTERVLAEIWKELLPVDDVGRHDDFFELGGHSLLAVRLMARVRQRLRREVPLSLLFERRILADCGAWLDAMPDMGDAPIVKGRREGALPLSLPQQRLWFLNRLDEASDAYTMSGALRLHGSLDRSAMKQALDRIVARHEVLRTTFRDVDGHPSQFILPATAGFELHFHDLEGHPDGDEKARELIHTMAASPFDLREGPLVGGLLIRAAADEHLLFVHMHHIVSDGWSVGIFLRELAAIYDGMRRGLPDGLPVLAIQYADYAIWQDQRKESQAWRDQVDYWRSTLSHAPALLELPTDRVRPPVQDHRGATRLVSLDASLTEALKALSQRNGTTLFMTLAAAWAALLSRLSGQDDVVIGTPNANRSRLEVEPLIGFFVNTQALRIDLSGNPTVSELLGRVRMRALDAHDHGDVTFEHVVEAVNPPRSLAYSPIFQVMFTWQNVPSAGGSFGDLAVEPIGIGRPTAKFDLSLTLGEDGGAISGFIEYACALFDESSIARYERYFRTLLAGMAGDEARRMDDLPLLPESEREGLRAGWNDTDRFYPDERRVHLRFEEHARTRSHDIAVVHEGDALSYGELNRKANRLAHHLLSLGAGPDVRIALCLDRTPALLVSMLAVLKAGSAYVPLDPSYPPARLDYMLKDSNPMLVLADGRGWDVGQKLGSTVRFIDVDAEAASWSVHAGENPVPRDNVRDLAYVIYTSGSTGQPKGVMIEHRGLSNMINWYTESFGLGPDDASFVVSSHAFDLTQKNLIAPLSVGGRVILGPSGFDPDAILQRLQDGNATLLNITPSMFHALVDVGEPSAFASLRWVIFGGEATQVKRLLEIPHPRPRFVNSYGPAECTALAAFHVLDDNLESYIDRRVPLGSSVPNTRIHILDERMRPVPIGVPGEIHIGGVQVGRGYLGKPELTASRYLIDPFDASGEGRLYKTGDLGRRLADGTIAYLGRNDFQVKIRGIRVELGEIESALRRHPYVGEALAVAYSQRPDSTLLVAYLTSVGSAPVHVELRSHLMALLPDYMIPVAFVVLERFPRSPNGKIDRAALPAPELRSPDVTERAPSGSMEEDIAAIWRELLGREDIGRDDNFFDLGGHSLLAIRLLSRIRRTLGRTLSVRDLFEHPTVRSMATCADGASGEADLSISHADRGAPLPLSLAQQRLWFMNRMDGAGEAYHISSAVRLHGVLDAEAMVMALDALVERHEILRTRFPYAGNAAVQSISAPSAFALTRLDLADLPARQREEEVERQVAMEARSAFSLETGPLIRGRLLKLATNEHLLLLTMHHIVSDGWSMGILVQEIGEAYAAIREGREYVTTALPIQYADYAQWQRRRLEGAGMARQLAWWKKHLDDAPALLPLPTDRPRPGVQSYRGSGVGFRLDAATTTALHALARSHGATLHMVLHAAYAVLLWRLSGERDVVIGSPVANRSLPEVERLIGFFVNTLALRLPMEPMERVGELIERTREMMLDAYQHQEAPFEQVVEAVNPPRSMAHSPLFQASLTLQNLPLEDLSLPGLTLRPQEIPNRTAKTDLSLYLQEVGGCLVGGFNYATDLFDATTIDRWSRAYCRLLGSMADAPGQCVDSLSLLDEAERESVVALFHGPVPARSADTACELFAAMVRETPDAPAVSDGSRVLTYAQLHTQVNWLARHLAAQGVGTETLVGLFLDRGIDFVVAALAVWKAYGAFVPLDPSYPAERLRYMLEDAEPPLVLTSSRWEESLPSSHARVIRLDELDTEAAAPAPAPVHAGASAGAPGMDALAYIIYTSGSTGRPKGVMVEHRGLANLVDAQAEAFALTPSSRVLQFASPGFDASISEILVTLCSGARLELASRESMMPGAALAATLRERDVSHVTLPPAALRHLPLEAGEGLRTLVVAGEACPPSLARAWSQGRRLVNAYGPTEGTVCASMHICEGGASMPWLPIGRPMDHVSIYLLDERGEPVPVGVVGEMWIGGVGVARGYLNLPGQTLERFVPDRFSAQPQARMYRTGDLARHLPDGQLVYVGRNDEQVKIRGFRIEPGEIEERLCAHPSVEAAAVVADGEGERLVAYVVTGHAGEDGLASRLRTFLAESLPDYMLPAAFVPVASMPLNANGKLDRRRLPAIGQEGFASEAYAAPEGPIETMLADIWSTLLGVSRVSRNDSFFALGGHSLLAVQMIERMREAGWSVTIKDLFQQPTLASVAGMVTGPGNGNLLDSTPDSLARPSIDELTPGRFPLIDVTQGDIDFIAENVDGGASNIQDIYALSPLQDGILFHHMLNRRGDTYLHVSQLSFAERSLLDRFLEAMQRVVDRHDILRTSFFWENVSTPAQVVCREATLSVEEMAFDPDAGPVSRQLAERFDASEHRIDLRKAPLLRFVVAEDAVNGRWLLLQRLHHLIGDHSTSDVMRREVRAFLDGRGADLPEPKPFRHLIAQARHGVSEQDHRAFFTQMLSTIDGPTLPFGLAQVHLDGSSTVEARYMVPPEVQERLRGQARKMGVSLASLCHFAWAMVLARVSARTQVVFGTVLLGRLQGSIGADQAMGLHINTLPLRIDIGSTGVGESVRATHDRLARLLEHEHASLAMAQRCSTLEAGVPLFSSLLNYRHHVVREGVEVPASDDIRFLGGRERTNYPINLSVEDFGNALGLTVHVVDSIDPRRVCAYVQQAFERLAEALDHAPHAPADSLDILPVSERDMLLGDWATQAMATPTVDCIHRMFEREVGLHPGAIALHDGLRGMTYAELNLRANRLAHALLERGAGPDTLVAVCMERSIGLMVACLAIWKSGAAYVPVDPAQPAGRIAFILEDADPMLLLVDGSAPTIDGFAGRTLDLGDEATADMPESNPETRELTPDHLAYVIYTSGSTGRPKGVMVEHRGLANLVDAQAEAFALTPSSRVLQFASPGFDASISEILVTLCSGARLELASRESMMPGAALAATLRERDVSHVTLPPAALRHLPLEAGEGLRTLVVAGEACPPSLARAWSQGRRLVNAYGPTEGTVCASMHICEGGASMPWLPIGRPMDHVSIYLLDERGEPVPVGVVGEMWIGGVGVARGYLNLPGQTLERFVPDRFSAQPQARMYRTGDLARHLPDGQLVYVGRNDEQVKIRGFRIEPGEIEERLCAHPSVEAAAVVADGEGERLVAYVVTGHAGEDGLASRLRTFLAESLPDYMLPAAFVPVASMPLNANGKLDRRRLPAIGQEGFASEAYAAPEGPIEARLADLWSELLAVDAVGRHDHFFRLGGHSILAIRMLSRLGTALGITVPLSVLFDYPVLADFAEMLLVMAVQERETRGEGRTHLE
ncbi:amino acid adenylation domain-containing protein [Xanthomonas sp. NCPPB 2632]|uniref:amino acid adenylation domain-containing protein n=1 Tax=Xanthomonas sp. NCPPB 2632 TaxID=3240912 RepID=UPI003514A6E0